jgi:acetamidase/formamidase
MVRHLLRASASTTRHGFLQAGLPPALVVASGDVVEVETLPSGTRAEFQHAPYELLPEHAIALQRPGGGPGPHMVTGPIHVLDAEPGDTLIVKIRSVRVNQPWGWNGLWPGKGALPDDFGQEKLLFVPFDRERQTALLPWGQALPLRPFFGLIATTPSAALGRVSTVEPWTHGGNLDNRDLVPGAELQLPVLEPGAGLWIGDGHALQGDGEVTQTALETALVGELELELVKGHALAWPRAETPTRLIAMGFHPDLDQAAQAALRGITGWIGERTGLARQDAFALFGFVGELRVTQLVDGNKGIHAVIQKADLPFPIHRQQ